MTTYVGWWQVPDYLLPATALAELEYPRTADGRQPATWVDTWDWSGRKTSIGLYDARACPPTNATARQLAATAARSGRQRTCAGCQRPLTATPTTTRRPLCPACRHVARLRHWQAQLAAHRPLIAERARGLLAWPGAAVVQVDLHMPPPTPAGRRRPPTAARVRAVDLDGARLVDVLVRLVGPRAHYVPAGAVAPEDVVPAIHQAVVGARLIMWSVLDLERLRLAAPHPDLPRLAWLPEASDLPQPHLPLPDHARAVAVEPMATRWRGQVDPHTRTLVQCLAPGIPDRLLLLLQRIAHTPPAPGGAGDHATQTGDHAAPAGRW
jgi:hypothetical protein